MKAQKKIYLNATREHGRRGRFISALEDCGEGIKIVNLNSAEREDCDEFTEVSLDKSLFLDMDSVQQLFDDLWQTGIRPSDGTGNVGELKATQKHLDDIKEIAYHVLKIKK